MLGRPGFRRSEVAGFWLRLGQGASVRQAAESMGYRVTWGRGLVRDAGGVRPRVVVSGRYLSFGEREQIALWRVEQVGVREIARRLGRSPSTISRELGRNGRRRWQPYLASVAQAKADDRARRPKPAKLAVQPRLRAYVEARLGGRHRCSPEQISARLRIEFPDDDSMRISPETIYQSLFVQGRGALRRELAACLRTGRAIRRPARRGDGRRSRIPEQLLISARPAEVEDRAVPGHWEGDLIIGKNGRSQIGTLVERSTRYVMLLHLPDGVSGEQVRAAMQTTIATLPASLRRTLTWDQGKEMTAVYPKIALDTGLQIYFCDPASPWQRGSNENTNGLLRQYLPKSTDLSLHTAADLADIAESLNGRPRKTLNWRTPAEALANLLRSTHT
jgi:transposase, IS30 family